MHQSLNLTNSALSMDTATGSTDDVIDWAAHGPLMLSREELVPVWWTPAT